MPTARGLNSFALAGESEIENGMVNLKNMETGVQQLIRTEELVGVLKGGALGC